MRDGERCRIVDFEDTGVGDPAYEIADLLEHPSVRLPAQIGASDLTDALGLPGMPSGSGSGHGQ